MTPVEFRFVTPKGLPIANAEVVIQLSASAVSDVEPGILMPREIIAVTDAAGIVLVNLLAGPALYYVSVVDPESEAALFYKFIVPVLDAGASQVRLQDIVVSGEMSGASYDDAALLIIHAAKADSVAARDDARLAQLASEAASQAAIETLLLVQGEGLIVTEHTNTTVASASQVAADRLQTAEDRGVLEALVTTTLADIAYAVAPYNPLAILASEALDAGSLINLWAFEGQLRARNASAADELREAHGFVLPACAEGALAQVRFVGVISGLTGLIVGPAFLSATVPGRATPVVPTVASHIVQRVGFAMSATELQFVPVLPITLA